MLRSATTPRAALCRTWKHRGRVFAAAPVSIRTFFVQVMLATFEQRHVEAVPVVSRRSASSLGRRVYLLVRGCIDVRDGRSLAIFARIFIFHLGNPFAMCFVASSCQQVMYNERVLVITAPILNASHLGACLSRVKPLRPQKYPSARPPRADHALWIVLRALAASLAVHASFSPS